MEDGVGRWVEATGDGGIVMQVVSHESLASLVTRYRPALGRLFLSIDKGSCGGG